MTKTLTKSISPIEQAKWIIKNQNILTDGSPCPPFGYSKEGKYEAGCMFCIVSKEENWSKYGCPKERKIKAAKKILLKLRELKLERINKK